MTSHRPSPQINGLLLENLRATDQTQEAGDATKKGIVGLVTDSRVQRGQIKFNLFLQGCIEDSGGIVTSVDEAVARLVAMRDEVG